MDDTTRILNHLKAIKRELDALWSLHGRKPPKRKDSGGADVTVSRDANNGLVFDRGGTA
jgi:hypothetical protein